MSTPKVFISYSHDSQEHKKWVLDLATRLRNSGVDAIIDQWELRPGDDLPHFMETHLANSDYVAMVCTDKYVDKANAGTGGVGYEKMIITADLLSHIDSNKVVPVIRQFGTHNVPTFLKTKLFVNFSKDGDYEFSFDELVRTFHDAPLFEKPEIGNNPFTPVSETPPEKTGDPIREIMKYIVADFENGKNYTFYKNLVQVVDMSRIMLDIIIGDAVRKGYIALDRDGDIHLQSEGKKYAIQHKLVNA
ncbi:toll/interleukin-1 receptor domain-containing protein [Shewanella sp. M16]|uniref:toll/interleukin-1 receptor domain-containing protein n=1 Tax=Shewanella TaxID=22 RepID=UPI0018E3BFBE|nr:MULTISPECIES: toll/interleukin-1 receptor domain-containing protein [unclassified Shewanella]MBI1673838.1 toll/interleukin-1 receptor domain-containing protein [Shewanella sp. DW31]MBS0045053.1 toll/interleukin-1 receptor domain-containing protein [Shewanella sp. M16]